MKKGLILKILYILALVVVVAFAAIFVVNKVNQPVASTGNKLVVVSTLFPVFDFARTIGGDRAAVSTIIPPGVEPHSFEPAPSDMLKVAKAGVFAYAGNVMEPWATSLINASENKKMIVVDASQGIKFLTAGAEDDDAVSGLDPHFWLDLGNAQIMVKNIAVAFDKADPPNAAYYDSNAATLENQLSAMDADFSAALKTCATKEIIQGGHMAFAYFAKRYGLAYVAAEGFSPDAEPSPAKIAAIVNDIRKLNAKYIFYEELVDPRVARTISAETGAKLLLLNAAHNISRDELAAGVTFIDIMREDLTNLKIGLSCTQ
jgi:zinc transport system substrate-binding protein